MRVCLFLICFDWIDYVFLLVTLVLFRWVLFAGLCLLFGLFGLLFSFSWICCFVLNWLFCLILVVDWLVFGVWICLFASLTLIISLLVVFWWVFVLFYLFTLVLFWLFVMWLFCFDYAFGCFGWWWLFGCWLPFVGVNSLVLVVCYLLWVFWVCCLVLVWVLGFVLGLMLVCVTAVCVVWVASCLPFVLLVLILWFSFACLWVYVYCLLFGLLVFLLIALDWWCLLVLCFVCCVWRDCGLFDRFVNSVNSFVSCL